MTKKRRCVSTKRSAKIISSRGYGKGYGNGEEEAAMCEHAKAGN
jgi:hypothetical protein